jgi:hypothetical protein
MVVSFLLVNGLASFRLKAGRWRGSNVRLRRHVCRLRRRLATCARVRPASICDSSALTWSFSGERRRALAAVRFERRGYLVAAELGCWLRLVEVVMPIRAAWRAGRPGTDANLGQHRGHVVVHGPLGYRQPPGDLPVGRALSDQLQDFLLAGGEPGPGGPGCRTWPARDRGHADFFIRRLAAALAVLAPSSSKAARAFRSPAWPAGTDRDRDADSP